MLFWLLLGALLIGTVAFTVSYVITKFNIIDTIKAALQNASTEAAKKTLESGFEAVIREMHDNVIKIDVLSNQYEGRAEKMDITINCAGIDSDITTGMILQNAV